MPRERTEKQYTDRRKRNMRDVMNKAQELAEAILNSECYKEMK